MYNGLDGRFFIQLVYQVGVYPVYHAGFIDGNFLVQHLNGFHLLVIVFNVNGLLFQLAVQRVDKSLLFFYQTVQSFYGLRFLLVFSVKDEGKED